MEELGLGLIGCGGMALHLARQALTLPGVRIAAVCDSAEEAAARAASELNAPAERDFYSVVKRPDVEAVVIATPCFLHEEPAVAAAAAGKHVFCEKPMATTLESCDRMIDACRAAGVTLMVGQVLRLFPVFHKTAALLRDQVVGEVKSLSITRTGSPGTFSSGWRSRFDQSGGLLLEVNAHEIDYMRHVAGDVETVYASSRRIRHEYDFDDTFHLVLRFRKGAIGHLQSSCASTLGDYRMTFECDNGTLDNSGFGGPIRCASFGEKEPVHLTGPDYEKEDPYRHELRLFMEAIESGAEPAIPATEARAAVEIALAAYRSSETGEVVKL